MLEWFVVSKNPKSKKISINRQKEEQKREFHCSWFRFLPKRKPVYFSYKSKFQKKKWQSRTIPMKLSIYYFLVLRVDWNAIVTENSLYKRFVISLTSHNCCFCVVDRACFHETGSHCFGICFQMLITSMTKKKSDDILNFDFENKVVVDPAKNDRHPSK